MLSQQEQLLLFLQLELLQIILYNAKESISSQTMSRSLHVMLVALLAMWIGDMAAAESNINRSCSVSCEVGSKINYYGFDANKEQVYVDEKRCVKVYISPVGVNCLPDEDTCQRECSPRSYEMLTYSNRTGPFMVKTIKRCYATLHHCQECQRKPHKIYFFPGSKYRRGVDVGKCSGVCSEEESAEGSGEAERERTPLPLECMATRTTTEAIEGPNGYLTVEVIQNCSCVKQSCYRGDYFQSVSVLVNDKRQEELVNTGRCIGKCSGITINSRCVQYSLDGRCIWFLPGTPAKCRPTSGTTFHYTDTEGTNKTLPIVEECGCTTG